MTTYYVRKTGSDGNAGTSSGAAKLTIQAAVNLATSAGDIVRVGAGVYYETVTLGSSGSSGNNIVISGDVTGQHAGDPGLVFISAFGGSNIKHHGAAIRSSCLDLAGKTFVTIENFVMVGTSDSGGVVLKSTAAGNLSFEGVIIQNCAILAQGVLQGGVVGYNGYAMSILVGNGATPSGANGLLVRNCKFSGNQGFVITHTNNASAHVNLKCRVENCEFYGEYNSIGVFLYSNTSNTFSIGGVTVTGCLFYGHTETVSGINLKNTTNPFATYNSLFFGCGSYLFKANNCTAGAMIENFNRGVQCYYSAITSWSSVTRGAQTELNGTWIPGLFVNHIYRNAQGWTPFVDLEPVSVSGYVDPVVGYGDAATTTVTVDGNGSPRSLGRAVYGNRYYINGSSVAASGTGWTSPSNITDADQFSAATDGTAGDSESSNFLTAGGTNAPGSGSTIVNVYVRALTWLGASSTGSIRIYTSADVALCTAFSAINANPNWTDWVLLDVPSGGWDWSKVQGLKFKAWFITKSGGDNMLVYMVEFSVETASIPPDIGPVETNTRPTRNTTTYYEGSTSGQLAGSGYKDFLVDVVASLTTITVRFRKDSNYSGTQPSIEALNIPSNVSNVSGSMSGGANLWEAVTIQVTPTAVGVMRVRVRSYDVSSSGLLLFDGLTVSS